MRGSVLRDPVWGLSLAWGFWFGDARTSLKLPYRTVNNLKHTSELSSGSLPLQPSGSTPAEKERERPKASHHSRSLVHKQQDPANLESPLEPNKDSENGPLIFGNPRMT